MGGSVFLHTENRLLIKMLRKNRNLSDNNFMKTPVNILILLIVFGSVSCVESKKTEESGGGGSVTKGKSFVSSAEIQVLNQVFEDQFADIGVDMLAGFTRFTGVSSLKSADSRGVSYLTNWCQDFKTELIDDKIDSVFSSTCTSECDQNIDKHNITGCTTSSYIFSCDGGSTSTTVSNLETSIFVDYSNYNDADSIKVNGTITGTIFGGDFSSDTPLDCEFEMNYKYGSLNAPTCDIFDIVCKIGEGTDQTTAYCEHILPSTTISETIDNCGEVTL